MIHEIDDLGYVEEQSTSRVEFSFADSTGTPQIPSSLRYSITDEFGNVINNRSNVLFAGTLGSTLTLTLTEDDTVLRLPEFPTRYLSILVFVNGDAWRREYRFSIRNARVIVVSP